MPSHSSTLTSLPTIIERTARHTITKNGLHVPQGMDEYTIGNLKGCHFSTETIGNCTKWTVDRAYYKGYLVCVPLTASSYHKKTRASPLPGSNTGNAIYPT